MSKFTLKEGELQKNLLKNTLQQVARTAKPDRVNVPQVAVAKAIIKAAKSNSTPFTMVGSKVAVQLEGQRRVLNNDAVLWLIERVIAQAKSIDKLPLHADAQAAYRGQFVHLIRQEFFNSKKAA